MPDRCVTHAGIVLLCGVLTVLSATASAEVVFVDREATGPGHDGSSWCTAFTELYQALEAVHPGDTIRIADGTYLPDTEGLIDPRDATFTIPTGVTIAGAYAGCGAPDPDERNPFTYVTLLSGDLDSGDNAYHVVTATQGPLTTLSGVTISGGNAVGGLGGGVLSMGGRLTFSVCTLTNNQAWRGGAIYAEGGELHLFRCHFTSNSTTGEGGAIFDATASLEAHNSIFALNSAGNDGGAIFCDLCSASFVGCSFGANTSEGRGGAIYDYVGVETVAGNCIFWGNSDTSGSGEESQIFINPSNLLSIDYSSVQGWTGSLGGEGNTGDDPLLADLPAGDMHLLVGSPCIDRGSNAYVSSQLDLDGNMRVVNGRVDMGCYEYQGTSGTTESGAPAVRPRILNVSTDPNNRAVGISFQPPYEGVWSLSVHAIDGRRVTVLDIGEASPTSLELSWDRLSDVGDRVPAGVYFAVLTGNGRLLDARKIVSIH